MTIAKICYLNRTRTWPFKENNGKSNEECYDEKEGYDENECGLIM